MSSGRFDLVPPPDPPPPALAWHAEGRPGERLIIDVGRLRELLDAGVQVEITDAGRTALDQVR